MTKSKIEISKEQAMYCLKAGSELYPEICEECELYGITGTDHCYEDATHLAILALEKQINGGWIPCSERLPEKSTRVLVTQDFDGYKNVTDASYFDNLCSKNFWRTNKINNVVAWKPLPEPYKAN